MKYLVKHANVEGYDEWTVESNDTRVAVRHCGKFDMNYVLDGNSLMTVSKGNKVICKIPNGEVYDIAVALLLMHKDKSLLGKAEVFTARPDLLYGDDK